MSEEFRSGPAVKRFRVTVTEVVAHAVTFELFAESEEAALERVEEEGYEHHGPLVGVGADVFIDVSQLDNEPPG